MAEDRRAIRVLLDINEEERQAIMTELQKVWSSAMATFDVLDAGNVWTGEDADRMVQMHDAATAALRQLGAAAERTIETARRDPVGLQSRALLAGARRSVLRARAGNGG